jgi:hypothetical protein
MWALAAIAAIVAVLAVAILRTSTAGPARTLRRDLAARAARTFPRPAHVETPETGTFGERAGAAWDALAALEASSADVELCRAVRDGEQPFGALSPSCRRELEAAAGQIRFKPARTRDGTPLDSRALVHIVFQVAY